MNGILHLGAKYFYLFIIMGDFPRPPTVHEQIYKLQMNLAVERSHRVALEAKLEHQTHQVESSSGHKKNKISRKAFSFKDYDGTKDARTILTWVSQLDDFFHDENFSHKDMVKCASNHLTGSTALWWNTTKQEGHRPRTWHAFQRAFKR